MGKRIIVNATALREGGALTILQQFIEAIPDDGFQYLVFVDKSVDLNHSKQNLQLIPQNVLSLYRRFKWDTYGLKKWLNTNNIKPLAAISLQNTNFRLNSTCPNYIYYHQPMPLYPYRWNIFKRNERSLWFYKNIYPYFVKIFINSQTEIFVQLNFIKDGFAQVFNFPRNKIHVVFPKIKIPTVIESYNINLDETKINLFYPSSSVFYKNHSVLFNSLESIDFKLTRKVVLYLTNKEYEFTIPESLINVEFVFLGQISFNEVLWMFQNVNCLVFPSYIETLGLPLIEAASFGLPIIAADLPYAREVLDGYQGVTYVDYQNSNSWGNEILKLSNKETTRFKSYKKGNIKTWSYFFDQIKENL
ncbi:MAG: glycosyltransferase [Paludibacter sp.]|nr:glycosyltransferase [Paludibacter sp.]